MDKDITAAASRRDLLRAGLAVLAAGSVVTVAGQARADDKLDQATVQYQTTPNAGAQCSNCVNYIAPSSCKLVLGTIVPTGWCVAYAPKT